MPILSLQKFLCSTKVCLVAEKIRSTVRKVSYTTHKNSDEQFVYNSILKIKRPMYKKNLTISILQNFYQNHLNQMRLQDVL